MRKQVDFTPEGEALEALMYDVSMQPIVAVGIKNNKATFTEQTSRYQAIVNESSNKIVCVVSQKYQLLTNKRALDMAKDTFTKLFKSVKADELIPFKVIAPKSGASCHIDLIHKDVKLSETEWTQDTWYPFLRMSNSYNRTTAFTMEMGFVRKLCSNGVIFSKNTIEIKYSHDKLNIEKIGTDYLKLKAYENEFIAHMKKLQALKLEMNQIVSIVCKALNLSFDVNNTSEKISKKEKIRYESTKRIINNIADGYLKEMESNGYAIMNVLTDFVSHQDEYKTIRGFSINPNAYYRRVGEWSKAILEDTKSADFNINDYLKGYIFETQTSLF